MRTRFVIFAVLALATLLSGVACDGQPAGKSGEGEAKGRLLGGLLGGLAGPGIGGYGYPGGFSPYGGLNYGYPHHHHHHHGYGGYPFGFGGFGGHGGHGGYGGYGGYPRPYPYGGGYYGSGGFFG